MNKYYFILFVYFYYFTLSAFVLITVKKHLNQNMK